VFQGPSSPAGDWTSLAVRLEHGGRWRRWQQREPALMAVTDLVGLPGIGLRSDPVTANGIISALAGLAARDGGDDPDAATVLVHVLGPGVRRIARGVAAADRDPVALVVGELVAQIRRFPSNRNSRSVAVSLLLSTRRELIRELPGRHPDGRRREVPIPPHDPLWANLEAAPGEGSSVNVDELLSWTVAAGLTDVRDVRLLASLMSVDDTGRRTTRHQVAAEFGVNERTVRRRRDRILHQLRVAAPLFLQAQAAA